MSEVQVGQQSIIALTDHAANKVRELLQKEGHPEYALRVQVEGGGCSGLQYRMGFDSGPSDIDEEFDIKGVKVLVDRKSVLYLAGTEIDYVDSIQGAGFKINNPNSKGSCGCGESFHT